MPYKISLEYESSYEHGGKGVADGEEEGGDGVENVDGNGNGNEDDDDDDDDD